MVVVVSGGDGAVPSVVAGLVSAPVIAVPTSVGYGASLGGISALLSSLATSSPGEQLLLCLGCAHAWSGCPCRGGHPVLY